MPLIVLCGGVTAVRIRTKPLPGKWEGGDVLKDLKASDDWGVVKSWMEKTVGIMGHQFGQNVHQNSSILLIDFKNRKHFG